MAGPPILSSPAPEFAPMPPTLPPEPGSAAPPAAGPVAPLSPESPAIPATLPPPEVIANSNEATREWSQATPWTPVTQEALDEAAAGPNQDADEWLDEASEATGPIPLEAGWVRPRSVSSSSTYYSVFRPQGFSPLRAIDGRLDTQWVSGRYLGAEAWIAFDFGTRLDVTGLRLKTNLLPTDAGFIVETSEDGTNWMAITERLRNPSWRRAEYPLSGQGRYVRLRFLNSPSTPISRFALFELELKSP